MTLLQEGWGQLDRNFTLALQLDRATGMLGQLVVPVNIIIDNPYKIVIAHPASTPPVPADLPAGHVPKKPQTFINYLQVSDACPYDRNNLFWAKRPFNDCSTILLAV